MAAELFRRAARGASTTPLNSLFWRSDKHEVDFIRPGQPWVEVKAGKASPFEFEWFREASPREKLLVINSERFETGAVRGVTLEDFLLDQSMSPGGERQWRFAPVDSQTRRRRHARFASLPLRRVASPGGLAGSTMLACR